MVPPVLSVAVVILWLSHLFGKLRLEIGNWPRSSRCEGCMCNCYRRKNRKQITWAVCVLSDIKTNFINKGVNIRCDMEEGFVNELRECCG